MAMNQQSKARKILGVFNPKTSRGSFLFFILVFMAIGGSYMAYKSLAATPTYVRFLASDRTSSLSTKTSIVKDSESGLVGNTNVSKITNGGTLILSPGYSVGTKQDCFVMHAWNGATVVLRSGNNKKTVTLPSNSQYSQYCINYSIPKNNKDAVHTVKVKKGGPVYVWGVAQYYTTYTNPKPNSKNTPSGTASGSSSANSSHNTTTPPPTNTTTGKPYCVFRDSRGGSYTETLTEDMCKDKGGVWTPQ